MTVEGEAREAAEPGAAEKVATTDTADCLATERDVIVVGTGPAGSAAAYFLAERGLDVLLLDKASPPRDKTCGDAVTRRGLDVIAAMGLSNELDAIGQRMATLRIVAPGGQTVDVPLDPLRGGPGHALVIPRLSLDDALRRRAIAAGAAFAGSTRVTLVAGGTSPVVVRAERAGRPIEYRAKLAIVATGADLGLLRRSGLLRREPVLIPAFRAYYDGAPQLGGTATICFAGVPLPGYGWVFPLPAGRANVGAASYPIGLFGRRRRSDSAASIYRAFVGSSVGRTLLGDARPSGPAKGYPLRTDFVRTTTYGPRVLLAGEAAGLVNPLTGEGIDCALESGRLAAEHAATMLLSGDLSRARHAAYDRALRVRFQHLFVFSELIRDLALNRPFLDRAVATAAVRPDLCSTLADAMLGVRPMPSLGLPALRSVGRALVVVAQRG